MLIKCPECELQVSDKALSCPHCGYPLKEQSISKSNSKKRMRLPNGFGQISKIKKKNLRNSYRAMVTVGKTPDGKYIRKSLKPQAYFKTYAEAYAALAEYNRNPYDLEPDITVAQLYDMWSDSYFKTLKSDASIRTITCAWAYCSEIQNMRVKDVRARHIKGVIENGQTVETRGKNKGQPKSPTPETKSRMKSLFNMMLDYAVEYELTDKNYARMFELSKDTINELDRSKRSHIIFTEDELQTLWDNVDKVKHADWIVIQCYMGWRPQELATLKLIDVNISNWSMCAGMKTEAGKQRTIPIHSRIQPLVLRNYTDAQNMGSEYLLNDKGPITYDKYANRFVKVIQELRLNSDHRPHDPRKTFITRAKKAGMDENALKIMVGHSVRDITESVYTERDLEWLRSDIEKLV